MSKLNFTYQQATIGYNTYGDGHPIMLIHGFGEDSRIWENQIPVLQKYGLVIVPDLPGSGASPHADNISNNIDGMATALLELLKSVTGEAAIVLGHSMGGYITMAMLAADGDAIKAIGLVHSSAAADDDEKKEGRLKAVDTVKQNGAHAFYQNMIPNLFAPAWKEANAAIVDGLVDNAKAVSDEATISYLQAMMNRPDRTYLLRNTEKPTLFLLGTEDSAVPVKKVMPQTHLPHLTYVHILEGCGHMGMLEQTDVTNEHLTNFVIENIG